MVDPHSLSTCLSAVSPLAPPGPKWQAYHRMSWPTRPLSWMKPLTTISVSAPRTNMESVPLWRLSRLSSPRASLVRFGGGSFSNEHVMRWSLLFFLSRFFILIFYLHFYCTFLPQWLLKLGCILTDFEIIPIVMWIWLQVCVPALVCSCRECKTTLSLQNWYLFLTQMCQASPKVHWRWATSPTVQLTCSGRLRTVTEDPLWPLTSSRCDLTQSQLGPRLAV